MEAEHLEELKKSIELASSGDIWLPVASIATLFGIIILLLIFIWNKSESSHKEKHEESAERHKASESQLGILTTIATELKADKEYKDREIKEIKANVKTNTNDIKEIYK